MREQRFFSEEFLLAKSIDFCERLEAGEYQNPCANISRTALKKLRLRLGDALEMNTVLKMSIGKI